MALLGACGGPTPPPRPPSAPDQAALWLRFPGLPATVQSLHLHVQPAGVTGGFGRSGLIPGEVIHTEPVRDPQGEGKLGAVRPPEVQLSGLRPGLQQVRIEGRDSAGITLYSAALTLEAGLQEAGVPGGFGRFAPGVDRAATPITLERTSTRLTVVLAGRTSPEGRYLARLGSFFTPLTLEGGRWTGTLPSVPTQGGALLVVEGRDAAGGVQLQGHTVLDLGPQGAEVQVTLDTPSGGGLPRLRPGLGGQTSRPLTLGETFALHLDAEVAPGGTQALRRAWVYWGDGTWESFTLDGGHQGALRRSHPYGDSGSFEVVTWVEDSAGRMTQHNQTVEVQGGAFQARAQGRLALELRGLPDDTARVVGLLSPVQALTPGTLRGVRDYPEQTLALSIQGTEALGSALLRLGRPYRLTLALQDAAGTARRSVAYAVTLERDGATLALNFKDERDCPLPQTRGSRAGCGGGGGGSGSNNPLCQFFGICTGSLKPLKFTPNPPYLPQQWNLGWPMRQIHPCLWPELRGGCKDGRGGWTGGGGAFGGPWGSYGLSWGDPHITTLDGGQFSSFLLGEFTYLTQPQDPQNGLQLQLRQARLDGFVDWASFNVAAAVRADGQTVQLELPRDRMITNRNTLTINGVPSDLARGYYALSERVQLEVREDNAVKFTYLPQGATLPVEVFLGTQVDDTLTREDVNEPLYALAVTAQVPPGSGYRGVLGTPDKNLDNDFTRPDGSVTTSETDFVEAWRVSRREDSLFAYREGEGPETFNLAQEASPPSPDDLVDQGFEQQVKDLLSGVCKAKLESVDPSFVTRVALDLAAGRTPANLLEGGLCGDRHVNGAGEVPPAMLHFVFAGQITLRGSDLPLPGATVTVTARENAGKVLCTGVAAEGARYACGSSDFTSVYAGRERLTVDYTISGRGAPVTFSREITLPTPNATVEVLENFEIAPQVVLRLRGRVTDELGAAVSGEVEVTQPIFNRAPLLGGEYEILLPLPDGVRTGEVRFTLRKGMLEASTFAPFDLREDEFGLVERTLNLQGRFERGGEYTSDPALKNRRILFTGRLLNTHLKTALGRDIPVVDVPVRVTSNALQGGYCETRSNTEGRYTCPGYLVSGQPFTATLSVDSGALERELSLTAADIPQPASVLSYQQEVFYAPTTVLLSGTVRTAAGQRLEGVQVEAQLPGLSENPLRVQGASGSDGRYHLYLTLPRTAQTVEGVLEARATLRTASAEASQPQQIPLRAAPGSVVTLERDFTLSARMLALTGRITHRLVPDLGVGGARVLVREAGGALLCDAWSSDDGVYGCTVAVGETPLSLNYEILGFGGARRDAVVFNPATIPVGTRGALSQSFTLTPATLKVGGVVRDASGQLAAGSEVTLRHLGRERTQTVNLSGRYTFYLNLSEPGEGRVQLTAHYRSSKDDLSASLEPSYSAAPEALTVLEQDLVLGGTILEAAKSAKVTFQGEVRHPLLPGLPLQGVGVEVWGHGDSAGLGRICQTTSGVLSATVHYRCEATFITGRDLSVAYRTVLNGEPLGTPLSRTVQIAQDTAFGSTVVQDLELSPRTLWVTGQISDLAERPMAGVSVRAEGFAVSARSDDQGRYQLALPLSSTQLAGRLQLTALYKRHELDPGLEARLERDYQSSEPVTSLPGSDLQIPLNARSLTLSGTVQNALAPEGQGRTGIPVRIEAVGEGVLCSTLTNDRGEYDCTVAWPSGGSLAVRYTVADQTLNKTLSPLPPAGGARTYPQNFTARPPTVRLQGAAKDLNGNALGYPKLTLQGEALGTTPGWQGSGYGEQGGDYDLYLALPAPLVDASLTVLGTHASGAQGQAVVRLSVPAATLVSLTQNLSWRIPEGLGTTLRLSGTVQDDEGRPLAGARLALTGSASTQFSSDAQGRFSTLLAFPDSATTAALRVTVTYGSIGLRAERTLTLPLTPRQLTLHSETFTFGQRLLDLSGTVVNAFQPEMLLSFKRLRVLQGERVLCEQVPSSELAPELRTLDCPGMRLEQREDVELRYTLQSDQYAGTSGTMTLRAAELPPVGQRGTLTLKLPVEATTLEVSGTVRDNVGGVLGGVGLKLYGGDTRLAQGVSDASGRFALRVTYPSNIRTTAVTLIAGDGAVSRSFPLETPLTLGQLTKLEQDVALNVVGVGTAQWTATLEQGLDAKIPAVGEDGTLYLTSSDDTLTALGPDGVRRWSVRPGYLERSPVLGRSGEVLVVAGKKLHAYSPSGEALWVVNLPGSPGQPVIGAEGRIHGVATVYERLPDGTERTTSTLYTLSATGELLWQRVVLGGSETLSVLSDGGLLLGGNPVQRFDPDGTPRQVLEWTPSQVVVGSDGRLYGEVFGGAFEVRDPQGTLLWSKPGGRLDEVVVDRDGQVYRLINTGLQAYGPNGDVLWTFPLAQAHNATGLLLAEDGTVFVSVAQTVYAVDREGTQLWTFEADQPLTHHPLNMGQGNTLFVRAGAGKVYALRTSAPGLARGTWAQLMRDAGNTSSGFTALGTGSRTLLSGTLRNAFWAEQPPTEHQHQQVKVRDASGALLCSALSDGAGRYECAAPTAAANGALSYQVQGRWGAFALDGLRPPDGSARSQDLDLPITTVMLSGVVRDELGVARAGVNVTLESQRVQTDTEGRYALRRSYPDRQSTATWDLTVSDGANTVRQRLTFTLRPQEQLEQTKNFTLAQRGLGTVAWQQELGSDQGALVQMPDGGVLAPVYTGQTHGVVRLDPGGRITHRLDDHSLGYTWSAPVVAADGTVYLNSNGQVLALTSELGEKWRKRDLSGAQLSLGSDGVLYARRQYTEKIVALSPQGETLWTQSSDLVGTGPVSIATDGTLLLSQRRTVALHPGGQVRWVSHEDSWNPGTVVLDGDQVYRLNDQYLVVYRQNGARLWQRSGVHSVTPAPEGGVYVLTSDPALLHLSGEGTELWRRSLAYSHLIGSALGDDGILYLNLSHSGGGSQVLALDLAVQGQERWRFDTDQRLMGSPLVGDGLVYLHTLSGRVVALNAASRGPAPSPFTRPLGDNRNSSALPQVPPQGVLRTFLGTLSNLHWPAQTPGDFAGLHVQLETRSGEVLCSNLSDATGRYRCTARMPDLEAQDLRYRVRGGWGEHLLEHLAPSGGAEVDQGLTLSIATLMQEGTVLGDGDTPLANQTVRLVGQASGPSGWEELDRSVQTGADGRYRIAVALRSGLDQVRYRLRVTVGGNSLETPEQQVAVPGGERVLRDTPLRLTQSGPGSVRWSQPAGDGGMALAPDGTLYASGRKDGYYPQLSALSPEGQVLWRFVRPEYGEFSTPVRAPDGTVYVRSDQGNLIAVDASGQQKWFVQVGTSPVYRHPTLAVSPGGTVYVAGDGQLWALNPAGTVLWRRLAQVQSPLSLDAAGRLHFHAGGQRRVWSEAGLELEAQPEDSVPGQIVLDAVGTRLVTLPNRDRLEAHDAAGDLLWQAPTGTSASDPVVDRTGQIYTVTRTGVLTLSPSGTALWQRPLDGGSAQTPHGVLLAEEGTLYAAQGKRVFALDAVGELLWTFTAQAELSTPPSMGPDGTLYVQDEGGHLYALQTTSTALAQSAWPKAGRDPANTAAWPRSSAPSRSVTVEGQLSNRFWGEQPPEEFAGLRVKAFDPAGRLVCAARADDHARYACTGRTPVLEAGRLRVVVQGTRRLGEAELLLPAGAADSENALTLDLDLALTTVHIEGQVEDSGGGSAAGLTVTVRGNGERSTLTDAAGRYHTALTELKSSLFEVYLTVEVGGIALERSLVAQEGALSVLEADFRLPLSGPGSTVWQTSLAGWLSGAPRMDAQGRSFACVNGQVSVWSLSGEAQPWGPLGGVACEALMLSNDRLYAVSGTTLSAHTLAGQALWTFTPDSPPGHQDYCYTMHLAQAASGVVALVECSTEREIDEQFVRLPLTQVLRLSAAGQVMWQQEVDGSAWAAPLVDASGGVQVLLYDRVLRYRADGTLVYAAPASDLRDAALDGVGLLTIEGNTLFALDGEGTLRWRYEGSEELRSVRVDTSRVLLEDGDTLMVLDSSGTLQDQIPLSPDSDRAWLIGAGGEVLVHDSSQLYALSERGQILWQRTLPTDSFRQDGLLLAPDGTAVLARARYSGSHGSPAYTLWALRSGVPGLSGGPWPTEAHDNGASNQQP